MRFEKDIKADFKCDHCDKTFGVASNRNRHMRRMHEGKSLEKSVTCSLCPYTCRDRWVLIWLKKRSQSPLLVSSCGSTIVHTPQVDLSPAQSAIIRSVGRKTWKDTDWTATAHATPAPPAAVMQTAASFWTSSSVAAVLVHWAPHNLQCGCSRTMPSLFQDVFALFWLLLADLRQKTNETLSRITIH